MRQNQQSEPPHLYPFTGILNPPPESGGIPGKLAHLNDLNIRSFALKINLLFRIMDPLKGKSSLEKINPTHQTGKFHFKIMTLHSYDKYRYHMTRLHCFRYQSCT